MKHLASQFKGLSDPTRLRILNLLNAGELCVCDLMAVLDIPQSTVSRHLAYLRNAGWVKGRRNGKWMYYRRPANQNPFQMNAFALLDNEFSLRPQAKKDSEAIMHRLATKDENECATACAKG